MDEATEVSELSDMSSSSKESVMADSLGFTLVPTNFSIPPGEKTFPVEFHCMKSLYFLEKDLVCTFSLIDPYKVVEGDSVALCKVTKNPDPHVIIDFALDIYNCALADGVKYYTVIYKAEHLPHDLNLYNLCYMSRRMGVLATSTPFRFGNSVDGEFIEVEDPHDPGLVIFKTRTPESCEIIDKLTNEKAELVHKCSNLEESISLLRREIEKLETALEHIHSMNRSLVERNKALNEEVTKLTSGQGVSNLNQVLKEVNEVKEEITNIRSSMITNENLNSVHAVVDHISASLTDLKSQGSVCTACHVSMHSDSSNDWLEDFLVENFNLHKDFPTLTGDLAGLQAWAKGKGLTAENIVSDCLNLLIESNKQLYNRLRGGLHTFASYKGQIEAMKCELSEMKDRELNNHLLLACIHKYEYEVADLKEQLRNTQKYECQVASLKQKIEMLALENASLRAQVPSSFSASQENQQFWKLQIELANISLERDNLKTQLMELRKETVGKVSLHQSLNSSCSSAMD